MPLENRSPPGRGVSQAGNEEGGAVRHIPSVAIFSDISAESSVSVRPDCFWSTWWNRPSGCSQWHLISTLSGPLHRPLCILSDVTQLCSLISRRKLCHSREGGETGRSAERWHGDRPPLSVCRNAFPAGPHSQVKGMVPKQGQFPMIRRWTPRPEMPRLEMKTNPTE